MKDIADLKIGFIGYGNMARAIAKGFLGSGIPGERMYACAGDYEKLKTKAAADGIHACRDAAETAEKSDLVFIAVKPYMVEQVIRPVRESFRDRTVISVAWGYHFDSYKDILPEGTHYLCTCPNTPVAVNQGIFVTEKKHSLTEEEYKLAEALLSRESLVVPVDTGLLPIAGTVSGCGPAFAAMFIEALADASVMYGIPRSTAYALASKMLEGTAALQLATGAHPGAMKDAVCSPSGSTIVGVASLERSGFRSAVIDAVKAIEEK